MLRRYQRQNGQALVRSYPVRITSAIEQKGGREVPEALLLTRVNWVCELASEVAEDCLARLWNANAFGQLTTRDAPTFAYRAVEKALGRYNHGLFTWILVWSG